MKKITLFHLVLLAFLCITSVNAEVYNKFIADIDSDCTNFGVPENDLGNAEVNIDYVDLNYDDVSQTFSIEVKADKTSGKLAKFFHFGVTDGAMPGGEGAIAHIYFDAHNLANPVATIYGYNGRGMPMNEYMETTADTLCGNSYGSWTKANQLLTNAQWFALYGVNIPLGTPRGADFPADKIFSSLNDPTNIFEEVSVTDLGGDTYIYRLTFKTSALNAYLPLLFQPEYCPNSSCRSYTYSGAQFDDLLGLWFWAAADATSSYSGDYLSAFNTASATCAICDQSNFQTKRYPKCTSVELPSSKIIAESPITIKFNVNDPDINDDESTTISVNYSGLPAEAKGTPENNQIVTLDASGNGVASVLWVPKQEDAGKYIFKASFAKDYGLGNLVTVPEQDGCIAEFEVEPIVPFCEEGDPTPLAIADGNSHRINDIALELDRRSKRNRNSVLKALGKDKINFGSAPLDGVDTNHIHFNVVWPTYNKIQATDSHTYAQCTNTEYCKGGAKISSIAGDLATFNDNIDTLNTTALNRAKVFEQDRFEYLRVVKGYKVRKARNRAKAAAADYVSGLDGINVNYTSATTEIDLYENTYGTERIECEGANTDK